MFAVVVLEKNLKNVVVPISWILSIDLKNLIKDGINLSQKYIIFYSATEKEPVFNLPCDGEFDDDGCFYGRIIEFFGKYLIFLLSLSHKIY